MSPLRRDGSLSFPTTDGAEQPLEPIHTLGHSSRRVSVYGYTLTQRRQKYSAFIKSQLPAFATAHPQIEFAVSPRPRKHPVLIGHYVNGNAKSICVKNMDSLQVLSKVALLRDASGEKVKKVNRPVTSISDSVRGVWSPYHGNGMRV